MDRNEITRLESLFHALVDIPRGAERDAAAIRLSGGDADLARRALALVDSDEQAEAANHAARQAGSAPRIYGNYRTIRPLGSGGMGAVYLAERADGQFQQTVAVKVVAPHVAGDAFRERFLAERQILAGLSHPNIAKLLDGGVTPDGTPYLVLEYVDGQPLDQYCDLRKMGIRARLEIFRKVCEPVAEAHRNLVVHRDLKPSNILVTADGHPMLLDFGTAKLLGNGDGAATATNLPMLTLRYSSPEQRSRSAITTSTDIFSLGVILYELLTGAWPFGDPSSPEQMLERFARETPMTAPHTAVTEEASLVRSTNLRSLKSSLAGDLGSVLGKALAPAREDRYESVQALSADVGNWLAGMPVTAKPPSFSYRAAKFLRRRWLPAVAATVFVIGLLASTLFAVYEAKLAHAEALKAEKVNQFLNDMLSSASEQNFDPQKFTVAQMLDAAAPRLESSWKGDPLIEATLRNSLGSSYEAVQKYDLAKQQLEIARATFQRLGRRKDEAESLFLLGVTAADAGAPADSIRYFHAGLERLDSLGKNAPPLLVFRIKHALADELSAVMNQDLEQAGKLFTEAIELAEREPSIPRTDLAVAKTEQGAMLINGKTAEAEATFYQAIALFQQQHYEGIAKGQAYYYLMILNSRRDNFVAAKEFARQYYEATLKSIGPDHVRTAQAKIMWARFRAETGETKEAVEQAHEAMQVVRKALPPLSSVLWTPLTNTSRILNLAGRFAEAEPLAREQLAIVDHVNFPEADARRAGTLVELGTALQGEKKYREATSTFERAERIYAQLGPVWALRAEQVRKKLTELRSQAEK